VSDKQEYSLVVFADKVVHPSSHNGVVRGSQQITATERTKLYRDLAEPETVYAEQGGNVHAYPWASVVTARVKQKVVELPAKGEQQAQGGKR
jgi:hypothetical protein